MDFDALGYASLLLVLALALLIAEFFVVSFGLLAIGAIASAGSAIYFAFVASDVIGWVFVIVVPLIAAATVRWGINRVQRSGLVPQSEISADAGYHHVAEELEIVVGTRGEMMTPARPSGRARFDKGDCDVQSRGRALERGETVVVTAIDGPQVFVELVDAIDRSGADN